MNYQNDTTYSFEEGKTFSLDTLPKNALLVVFDDSFIITHGMSRALSKAMAGHGTVLTPAEAADDSFIITHGMSRALSKAMAGHGTVLTPAEAAQRFPDRFSVKQHNVSVLLSEAQYKYAKIRGKGSPAKYIREFIDMDMNLNPIKPMKT